MAELTLIYSATSPAAINVVFIHGLGGDSRKTWMYNPKDHTSLWPGWIGKDGDCNVWIASYGAAISGWDQHAMHLAEQGMAFMSALLYEPGLIQRPLVLVGHSLGGLVIKSGLVQAKTYDDPRFNPVLDAIAGVVFVGTPHQGSSVATAAAAVKGLLRTNEQVVNMTSDDAYLKMLNGQFRALQAILRFHVSVFYETQGVFVGRRILGMSIGPRILIVDRNSSDPHIPTVVPTPIDGDHIQIAKPANREAPIHKAMLSILRDLVKTGGTLVASDATAEAPLDTSELQRQLTNASTPLLNWPTTVPGGGWLARPELDSIANTIGANPTSLTLVLGEPGSGKSALLARLGQKKLSEGWPVVAIKADRLPEDIRENQGLALFLGIKDDPADAIRKIAKSGPVLVLVDQLDALADLVVQHSARLRVLLDLIRDLFETPNVHVVSSCRTFEQRHDPSLRTLEASSVTLDLPKWEAVQELLVARGVNAAGWNEELKEVLRSPHALDVFLTLLDSTTELDVLKSFQGMLQLLWETRILVDSSGRRKQLMLELARKMAEREALGLPLAAVEDWLKEIQELTADGLLRFDSGSGRVEFRHQTLYEFVRARSFLDEAGSLAEAVLTGQSSLRIRPQLWHALAYLRTASPESYGSELTSLWGSGLRPHLRMLVIEFLGRQPSPLPAEVQLVFGSLDDIWFLPRFLNAAVDSPGWFAQLAGGHLPAWMALPAPEAFGVVALLERALKFDPDAVIDLVRQVWIQDPAKDELSWRVLGMGDVAPQSPKWVGYLEAIALRTTLAEWTIGHVAGIISATLPDQAPRIIAASLKRQLAAVRAETTEDSDAASDPPAKPTVQPEKIRTILEAHKFYDLPAIAEAAPRSFVEAVWPIYTELLTESAREEHDFLVGFRDNAGLISDEMDDEDGGQDRPLLDAMWKAIQGWAEVDARAFLNFVGLHSNTNLQIAERLLAKGIEQCAAAFPTETLAYLQSDTRRLVLGPYSDVHKESVALIRAMSPHLNAEQFGTLETLVSEWKRYKKQPDGDDASTKQKRLRWNRQHRLRMLRGLPKERCNPAIQKLIDEEERAFPGLSEKDVSFSGVQGVGSPVTVDQMGKAKDEDILNLFNELGDESGWDHPKHWMKGGAIQAGRELASLAKKDLAKVIRIVRALEPGKNEIPVGTVLRDLGPVGYPTHELFALVEELSEKGFNTENFRQDAAYAVSAAVSPATPMPDSLMRRMEGWLKPVEPHEAETRETSESSEARAESVLWSHGRMNALPNGNFPVLSALTEACLKSEPSQMVRWLEILETHLLKPESPVVWNAMGWRYFSKMRFADRARAEKFLDALFYAYPVLLGTHDGVHLLAEIHRWFTSAGVRRWLQLMEETRANDKGLGELALLRHATFPAELWAREMVSTALAGTSEAYASQRVGIAYAVAHLWTEPMARSVVQPYLLQLAASDEESVLKALSDVFITGGFGPDAETRQFLDVLSGNKCLLIQPNAERLPEILESLVVAEPKRVFQVASALLDAAGEQFGNIATSWYLGSEWLLAIALRLQDLGDVHRQAGSTLFERMLEFNLPQARELTLSLDKRTSGQASSRPAIRRQRKKPKKPRTNRSF